MDTKNMIEVTGVDLRKMIKTAYALSKVQGMGVFHAREGDLDDQTVDAILDRKSALRQPFGTHSALVCSMDYVHGRSCKFHIHRDVDTGQLWIQDRWYDHSDQQLAELLAKCGVRPPTQ